jgi:TonB family protein
MTARIITLVALAVMSGVGTAAGQDALARAKTLYADANYEGALKLLESSGGSLSILEVNQYRAMCLLALGRPADAERAAAAAIEADPFFKPDDADVSPRVVNLFSDVRRRVLPSMIQSRFDEAKRSFSEGNRDRARGEFENVVRLIDDPVLSGNILTDLKVVAAAFVELVAASTPAPSLRAALPPAPGVAAAAAIPASRAAVIPAAVVQQTLPSWQPRDPFAQRRELGGTVKVAIDETGKVTAATIERSIHPEYDRVVLIWARRWRYQPATREGVPIPSEKIVVIRVRPR